MNKKKILNLYQQAMAKKQQGDRESAINLFKKVLSHQPSSYEAWFELGSLNFQQAKYSDAKDCFMKVVVLSPSFVMGHAYLGLTNQKMDFFEDAVISYKNVLNIDPTNIAAICNVALSLLNMGHREDAVNYCYRAIAIDERFFGAHLLLANALSALGKFEDAYERYSIVKDMQPDDMSAVGGMANSLIKLGQYQKAYDFILPYVEGMTENIDLIIAYASISKKMECADIAQQHLELLLDKKHLTNDQYIQLYFSVAELCDKTSQYDKAFEYYQQANKRVVRCYNADDDRSDFDEIISTYSGVKVKGAGDPVVQRHVFIVGMPRSGTSLVEQILSQHPHVFSAGELNKIPELASDIATFVDSDKSYPECVVGASEKEINKMSLEYVKCFSEAGGDVEIFTDKLPHNFMFLGFIERLFPNALVIHCKRSPLDTCLSNYFQYFSGSIAYPYSLKNIGTHYLQYQRLMRHWGEVLSLPILEVNYEDLVFDQEAVSRSIIKFCGLTWDAGCLKFYDSKRVARTASYSQVREKIYSRSVDRWKNYENHLEPLIKVLNSQ